MTLLIDLPVETLLEIYSSCLSVHDVINLSQTCRRLYALLSNSQKLPVLLSVAEVHSGPIFDIVQLLTVNDAQAAHEIRQPSVSYHLLRDIISVGHTAQKWQEIYPKEKWDENYDDRRVLNFAERFSLRRAIYRLWLFSRAFHNNNYPRESRLHPTRITERCRLLRAWSTEELAEIEDFRGIMRSFLEWTISGNEDLHWELEPASGRHHQKRRASPIASGLNLDPSTALKNAFHGLRDDTDLLSHRRHNIQATSLPVGMYGWVDDITKFYILEDLMKLDPEQVLCLGDIAYLRMQVPDHIGSVREEWFMNNGDTFAQTFEMVMADRGEDAREIRERIAQEDLGIARRS